MNWSAAERMEFWSLWRSWTGFSRAGLRGRGYGGEKGRRRTAEARRRLGYPSPVCEEPAAMSSSVERTRERDAGRIGEWRRKKELCGLPAHPSRSESARYPVQKQGKLSPTRHRSAFKLIGQQILSVRWIGIDGWLSFGDVDGSYSKRAHILLFIGRPLIYLNVDFNVTSVRIFRHC